MNQHESAATRNLGRQRATAETTRKRPHLIVSHREDANQWEYGPYQPPMLSDQEAAAIMRSYQDQAFWRQMMEENNTLGGGY